MGCMSIADRVPKLSSEHGEIEMLTAYPASTPTLPSPASDGGKGGGAHAAGKASWLDLLDPTPEERASVERDYGLELPSREDLSEVESSSRIAEENGVLFLSMPIVSHARALEDAPSPIGFVLSKDLLVTIRYTQLRSFDAAAAKFCKSETRVSSVDAFATLVEEMVDRSADLLEGIAAELDAVSRSVFLKTRVRRRRHVTRSNDALHRTLIEVGNAGERLSQIRGSLLGLQRIVQFASERERDLIPSNVGSRLKTAQTDLLSLTDYETHLSDKVQFLLGRGARLHQHEAERYLHRLDDRFGRRHSADPGGEHLRNEFQEYAGARLGLGLSVRPGADCAQHGPANSVVQVARVAITTTGRRRRACAGGPEREGTEQE